MENKNLNILIVEDEIIASEYLTSILESLEYSNIFTATSFKTAQDIIKENNISLVFMDINIDGAIDGIESAKILNQHYFLPIIYTSAFEDDQTLIEASETNIFGYIIKPFGKNEVKTALLVACKSINKRDKNVPTLKSSKDIVELGKEQKFNMITNTFYIKNIVIDLTKKEMDILKVLCENLNQNISYDTLKELVWQNTDISNSTIRDTISRLKRKAPELNIQTIINFGYILKKNN